MKFITQLALTTAGTVAMLGSITAVGAVLHSEKPAPESPAVAIARKAQQAADKEKRFAKAMIKRCESELKITLKDPSSYRKVSGSYLPWGNESSVTIAYSATNSFGGRIQDQHVCRYIKK